MKRDKRRKGAGSGLLHNMSGAPQAQIQHKSPHRRVCGPGTIFALPENRLAEQDVFPAPTWLANPQSPIPNPRDPKLKARLSAQRAD